MTIKTIVFNTILKEGWHFRGRAEKLDKLISPFAHTFLIISIISRNPAEDWGGEISHLDPALLYAGKHHVNKLCFYLLCCRKLTRCLRSSISYPDSPFSCSWRDSPSLFKKKKRKYPAAIWCQFTKQLQLELTCKMQDTFYLRSCFVLFCLTALRPCCSKRKLQIYSKTVSQSSNLKLFPDQHRTANVHPAAQITGFGSRMWELNAFGDCVQPPNHHQVITSVVCIT